MTYSIGLLLSAAGYVKLLTMAINRWESRPIRDPQLRCIRGLHELLIIVTPLWLLGWLAPWGLPGPDLNAAGGELWLTRAILGLGWLGCLYWLITAWQTYLRPLPAAFHVTAATVIDWDANAAPSFQGTGARSLLSRLPGNQQFTVERRELTLALPQLPADWRPLRIGHLSDLHFSESVGRAYFEEVLRSITDWQPELWVFTGDLLDRADGVDWLPTTLGRLSAPLGQYFVLGNHDWLIGPEPVRQALVALGWQDATTGPLELSWGAHGVLICGTERPWMGSATRWPARNDYVPDQSRFGNHELWLQLSHSPDEFHRAIRDGVDLVLAGHTHGGQVRLPLLGPIFSPSWYGTRYSAGAFSRGSTHLFVSRGLSGREPLRIGCRPEVTLLTVISANTPS